MGIGLKRMTGVGNGDQICDFRFKKSYNTSYGWPPEELPELKLEDENLRV